uniref:Uncharacterized protein n=1 Tax=Rhizophora mucronata TaxID=61149 RepID=A0A2P2QN27_RHIMU
MCGGSHATAKILKCCYKYSDSRLLPGLTY